MATCCGERAVLVAVYVERPTSNYQQQQHFRQANRAGGGRRYNRRAELLDYARDLRSSARSGASSPVHSSSHIIQPRAVQITPPQRKMRKTTFPTCFGNWKLLLPSFLNSMTASRTSKRKKKTKNNNSVSTITKMTTVLKRLQATCCGERAVLVAVYVERPTSNYQQQQHFRQANRAGGGRRYNRRAELLDYARDLRSSARSGASSPVHSSSHIIQPRAVQITPPQRKMRKTTFPTCFGNWKLLLPSFLNSMTASRTSKRKKKTKNNNSVSTITKMTTVLKRLQMQKKKNFLSNLFAKLRDHR